METDTLTESQKKHLAYRKRCEENPFRMYMIVKSSWCKIHKVDFDLDEEYLRSLWTGICPVFGIPLNIPLAESKGRGSNHTAHLDRKDPDKGYIKGNVTWLSGRANRIKYNASASELRALLTWMEAIEEKQSNG